MSTPSIALQPYRRTSSSRMARRKWWVEAGLVLGVVVSLGLWAGIGRTAGAASWMVWLLVTMAYYARTKPEITLNILALAVPFEFLFYGWGVGKYNVLAYAAAALLAVWITRKTFRIPLTGVEWIYIALVTWCFISVLWSVNQTLALQGAFTYAAVYAVFYIFVRGITRMEAVRACLWYFIAGVLLLSLIMLYSYETSALAERNGKVYFNSLRADEVSPYDFATAAQTAMFGALALWEFEDTKKKRKVALGCAVILGVYVLLTLSRASTLEMFLGSVVWGVLVPGKLGRSRKIIVAVMLLSAIVAAAVTINPGALETRWAQYTLSFIQSEDGVDVVGLTTGRSSIWETGFAMFKDKPWTGVGIGQFQFVAPDYGGFAIGSHSAILGFLTETGLIGLLLFIGFAIGVLRFAWQATTWRHVTVAWWTCFAIECTINGFYRNKSFWVVAALTLAIVRMNKNHSLTSASENLTPPRRPGYRFRTIRPVTAPNA